MLENSQCLVGTGRQKVAVRVVNFCDLESQTECALRYQLA